MSTNPKITRDLTTRELQERPKQWRPPELLPEPDKQAGYAYRWVAVSYNGKEDPRNLSSRLREGYELVRAEEQPKYQLLRDSNGRYSDNIEIGGLVLCKIPEETVEQRNAYYAKHAKDQADAVDHSLMRQSDARMPIFKDSKSEVKSFR